MVINAKVISNNSISESDGPTFLRIDKIPTTFKISCFINSDYRSNAKTSFFIRLANFLPRNYDKFSLGDVSTPYEILNAFLNLSNQRHKPRID